MMGCFDLQGVQRTPYGLLITGGIFFCLGTIWTFTGKAWTRLSGCVYRSEEPAAFWWGVAACYLVGVCFLAYFFYAALPN